MATLFGAHQRRIWHCAVSSHVGCRSSDNVEGRGVRHLVKTADLFQNVRDGLRDTVMLPQARGPGVNHYAPGRFRKGLARWTLALKGFDPSRIVPQSRWPIRPGWRRLPALRAAIPSVRESALRYSTAQHLKSHTLPSSRSALRQGQRSQQMFMEWLAHSTFGTIWR